MPKSNLEKAIETAAGSFALQIVEAVKGATLEELLALQGAPAAPQTRKKPGPKPKARKKPGPKPKARKKPGPKPKRKPGRPPKAEKAAAAPLKKKRVVKNYPKCAYPRCNKNRFVRGKGFCGEHWRLFEAGKIESAEFYKKGGGKGKVGKKKAAKK